MERRVVCRYEGVNGVWDLPSACRFDRNGLGDLSTNDVNEALTALENKGGRALSHARIVRHIYWAFPCAIAALVIFTFGDVLGAASGTQEDDDAGPTAQSILEFIVPMILFVGFMLIARYVSATGVVDTFRGSYLPWTSAVASLCWNVNTRPTSRAWQAKLVELQFDRDRQMRVQMDAFNAQPRFQGQRITFAMANDAQTRFRRRCMGRGAPITFPAVAVQRAAGGNAPNPAGAYPVAGVVSGPGAIASAYPAATAVAVSPPTATGGYPAPNSAQTAAYPAFAGGAHPSSVPYPTATAAATPTPSAPYVGQHASDPPTSAEPPMVSYKPQMTDGKVVL